METQCDFAIESATNMIILQRICTVVPKELRTTGSFKASSVMWNIKASKAGFLAPTNRRKYFFFGDILRRGGNCGEDNQIGQSVRWEENFVKVTPSGRVWNL